MKLSSDRVRSLLHRRPFTPLLFRRRDGRSFRVTLPDQVHVPPGARWLMATAGSIGRLELESIAEVVEEPVPAEYVASEESDRGAMTIQKFDEFLTRRPFVPFTIHTTDGAQFFVRHPELASRTEGGRTIFVSTGGERTEWIDLMLVVRISAGVDSADSSAGEGDSPPLDVDQ